MKKYQQLSREERSTLAALRGGGYGVVEIAKVLGRHRSTIWREVERNRAAHDGRYRAERAQEHAVARRRRSRRNGRIGADRGGAVAASGSPAGREVES